MCEGLSTINGPIPPHPMFLTTKDPEQDQMMKHSSRDSVCEGPSKILKGPIQNDYSLEDQFNNIEIKPPRVRSKGYEYYEQDRAASKVALLLQMQGRAITPRTFKMREKPKNYMHDNVVKVRQLMHKVKERQQLKQEQNRSTPVKALWKSKDYEHVESRLKELLNQQPLAPRDVNRSFLRAHSRTGSRPQSARPAQKDAENTDAPLKMQSKDDMDFVKLNKSFVKDFTIKRAPSVENLKRVQTKKADDLGKYDLEVKGKIPDYLKKRKEQLLEERNNLISSMPDPDQPPGHRKLPETERIQTLQSLKETQQRLLGEVNSLPIRSDTHRIRTIKLDYEKKLAEVEEAIKLFSRPKVFVKLDS